MKRLISFFVLMICLNSCSTVQAAPILQDRKKNLATMEEYFKNPKDKLMTVIQSTEKTNSVWDEVSINLTIGMGLQNNASEETFTPIVAVMDLHDMAEKMRETFKTIPEKDRPEALLRLAPAFALNFPTIVVVAQSQSSSGGIQGAIYFDGEKKSSSIADMPYGVVNLTYSIQPEDILKKSG
jgi:hypothetical protein